MAQGRANRRDEDRRPSRPKPPPGEDVRCPAASIGQADRYVDGNGVQSAISLRSSGKILDFPFEVRANLTCGQDDPDPSRSAAVDAHHAVTAHLTIMPAPRRPLPRLRLIRVSRRSGSVAALAPAGRGPSSAREQARLVSPVSSHAATAAHWQQPASAP